MRNRNFLGKVILMALVLLVGLTVSNVAEAQFNIFKGQVKRAVTADSSNNTSSVNSDVEDAITNAYVFYLSKIAGFEARLHNAAEVTNQARGYAAKLEAALRSNPEYRTRRIAQIVRDDSTEMTAGELLEKLNHADEIINQGQSDVQARNMSYFVEGDVDDWKNRMNRLDAKDGFILLANYEYPLLFNRAEGEKQALAKYIKSNGDKSLPASVIAPLHKQIDELLAQMNAAASSYSFSGSSAKPVEPNIVGFIKNQAGGNIAGATILKTAWLPGEWIIDKNDLGVPTMRSRLGTALYRVPSQNFCVEQHFFYEEKYAGGGRYQRANDVNFSDLRFVKCK